MENEERKKKEKSHLIEEIKNRGAQGRDLRGADLVLADLRGVNLVLADLRGANLISADLSFADLSGVYLSGATVDNALFANNKGMDEKLKLDLIERGAICRESSFGSFFDGSFFEQRQFALIS